MSKDFGALLADLSKGLDFLDCELLIAKFNACGFTAPSLKLVHDFILKETKNQGK